MHEAVIIDAVRTPMGKARQNGRLAGVHPTDLLAHAIRSLMSRNSLEGDLVDDVIAGCVGQVGEQSTNIARSAALAAGLPEHVPGTTVDRQCGSSQQAAHFAAQGIMAGSYDAVIACGVESMSRVPMSSQRLGADYLGLDVAKRYPEGLVNQGISAELIAARWKLTREDADAFGARSQRLAAQARDSGAFRNEIVPIAVHGSDGAAEQVDTDEGIRATDMERLAGLRPAFEDPAMAERYPQIRWSVTAGNSSQLTDGAAAVLIMNKSRAESLGLRGRAVFRSFAVIGDDPLYKLTGVIPATRSVLERSRLQIDDIDLFEVNEAFASVVLSWQKETNADPDRVNVHGGAIALGHPLGASGARLTATLLNALEQRNGRYGLQVMCEGGGMANAMILEVLR